MTHWLLHILGMDNLSGAIYGAWSGWGGDLTIAGAFAAIIRKMAQHHRERLAQSARQHRDLLEQQKTHHAEMKVHLAQHLAAHCTDLKEHLGAVARQPAKPGRRL